MNYTFYIHYFIQSLKQFHNKYYYPHLTNEEIEGQKSQGACPHFAHRLCHRVGTQAKITPKLIVVYFRTLNYNSE